MEQPEYPPPLAAPDDTRTGDDGFDHGLYQRRMKRVAAWSAGVGVVLGVLVVTALLLTGKIDKVIRLILSPILFGIGGYGAGAAAVCLFAPRAFLTGPVGRPWMKWVGTKSATVMRIICTLIALFAIVMVAAAVMVLVFVAIG